MVAELRIGVPAWRDTGIFFRSHARVRTHKVVGMMSGL